MQDDRADALASPPSLDEDRGGEDVIVRQKLSDLVFEKLWHMIETAELAPGDTLPSERALMDRFKVGRPAVREALQSMANKGLITINHGERSRVNRLTAGMALHQIDDMAKLLLLHEPAALDHLKQLRKLLEAGTTRLAAGHCTARDAADLRAILADQRSKLEDEAAFIEADIAFHVRIAAISRNPLIQTVTQAMLGWLFDHYKPMLRWSGREQTTMREHDHLVDLLAANDADGAEAMMLAHLNRSDPLYDTTQDKGIRTRTDPRARAAESRPIKERPNQVPTEGGD